MADNKAHQTCSCLTSFLSALSWGLEISADLFAESHTLLWAGCESWDLKLAAQNRVTLVPNKSLLCFVTCLYFGFLGHHKSLHIWGALSEHQLKVGFEGGSKWPKGQWFTKLSIMTLGHYWRLQIYTLLRRFFCSCYPEWRALWRAFICNACKYKHTIEHSMIASHVYDVSFFFFAPSCDCHPAFRCKPCT